MPHSPSPEEEFYYDDQHAKAFRQERDDMAALCNAQAVFLLEHLDPYVFAVQASATGVVLYPRQHVQKLTTWEQTLRRTELPIPAEWIGGLAAIDQQQQMNSKTSSDTSETLLSKSQARAASERAQAVAFSLIRFNQRLEEFSLGGATSGTKSIPDASQSISKARSGARRWKRSARDSSKTS